MYGDRCAVELRAFGVCSPPRWASADADRCCLCTPQFNQTTYDLSTVHDIIFYDVWRAGEAETTPFTGVAGGDGGGSADEALRAVVAKGAWVPKSYPLYKQCNASWGNDIIETTTVCKVGCLMSSTSMALAGHTITIPAASGAHVLADPGSVSAAAAMVCVSLPAC